MLVYNSILHKVVLLLKGHVICSLLHKVVLLLKGHVICSLLLIADIYATSILAGKSYRTDPDHKTRERKGSENLQFFTYDIVLTL